MAENYLQQDFTAERIVQKWVSDLTYIKTDEGWLYLTTVLDLADRKVIGWALSETMKAIDTTVAAFKMATANRPVVQPLLFHSDRGVQYACSEFNEQLKNGLSLRASWLLTKGIYRVMVMKYTMILMKEKTFIICFVWHTPEGTLWKP